MVEINTPIWIRKENIKVLRWNSYHSHLRYRFSMIYNIWCYSIKSIIRVHLVTLFIFWFLKNIFYFFLFLLLSKSKKVKNIFDNQIAIMQKQRLEMAGEKLDEREGFGKGGKREWGGEKLDKKEEFRLFIFWFDVLDVGK